MFAVFYRIISDPTIRISLYFFPEKYIQTLKSADS